MTLRARHFTAIPFLTLAACAMTSCELSPLDAPYTEERVACADHDPLRRAYFGDLHVHTAFSFDAWTYDVRTTPAEAYRFARGETIKLPPLDENGVGTTEVRIDRPLDFAAVTDHAEYLGEVSLCTTPGSPAYDTDVCKSYRPPESSFLGLGIGTDPPVRAEFCQGTTMCTDAVGPVWRNIQDAAEAAYDRSATCGFTSFVAYEYSLSPFGTNLHRNVIFRNAKTVAAPITTYEAPSPEKLWTMLRAQCSDAGEGCDVLAIPHNSNLSNGQMFHVETHDKRTAEEQRAAAEARASMEPLVEIFQHKGDSECINGLPSVPGAPDELCDMEKQVRPPYDDCGRDGTGWGANGGLGCASWRDYVRGALETGLMEEERIGANPFKLGIIASTDTHNGTPGRVDEASFRGHLGLSDDTPELLLTGNAVAATPILANPGGLAGVWAEENSRDAIFDALRRRETFGTSGPRISVRLFAGWDFEGDLCGAPDLVAQGYARGAPMGGDLPPAPSASIAPSIVVTALRDPGTAEKPGALLQRAQVIKLWIGPDGEPRESVIDVAGDAENGATVDTSTCAPKGPGAESLCAVWRDPDFDPARPALYYARVVENPTCRWSAHLCATLSPEKRAALHCDALPVPATIQERAWTSPVWYTP
ncbi:MAG: DUF3604 domain-containing protein [Polyangiaceae bacterium]